jgi:LmbE family N-acetylglucosaminyl deacetylase
MVVVAHPDDAEFGCAGTIAKRAKQGAYVVYVVCTNGDKGTPDPSLAPEELTRLRQEEQRKAAELLGVRDVVFLGYGDGMLEDTLTFRKELVRLIRRYRPDTVFTMDPYRHYQFHRDHRIVGLVTLDAVFPYARDRLHFPELLGEGLEPHKVKEVFLFSTDNPDTYEDVTEVFPTKVAALGLHASQMSHIEGWQDLITQWAQKAGEAAGVSLAEAFKRLEMRR